LLLRGKNFFGFAEAVPDEEGSAEVLDAILRRYPDYGRFVGVTLDEDGRPDGKKVRDAARRGRVGIRVRPREQDGA
jgi:hypothetical protein